MESQVLSMHNKDDVQKGHAIGDAVRDANERKATDDKTPTEAQEEVQSNGYAVNDKLEHEKAAKGSHEEEEVKLYHEDVEDDGDDDEPGYDDDEYDEYDGYNNYGYGKGYGYGNGEDGF